MEKNNPDNLNSFFSLIKEEKKKKDEEKKELIGEISFETMFQDMAVETARLKKEIIEKGQEAINGILELAQESEMPRAYEVAGQLIKNVADATDKLMDLQKKLKDVNKEEEAKTPTTVNNALFVGSTAELQKLLKKNDSK